MLTKKLGTTLTGTLAAATLAFAMTAAPASAQTVRPADGATECAAAPASPAATTDDGSGSVDMTQLDATASGEAVAGATALLDGGGLTVHAAADAVDREGAKAYLLEAGGETFTSVTFPVAGDHSALLSNLTVVTDADGGIVQYAETLVGSNAGGTFQLTTYVDGTLVNDEDTGIAFVGDEQLTADVAGSPGSDVVAAKNTGACLATVLGVSGVVGAIIAKVCVGACAVPMTPVTGPVCAACVGGFAVVGGASIGAIASCF
ncbi:hypothetical protein [Serinibacter arcticus]|uniref:Uncharacterized protein n=1 Tax=Serinibacter arcticus TaxID=1655435 RepID=A0A4Z1E3W8_9MICO|nr:hypothetical protein [Serinibacter arcticus]TGO05163.1 hypothetical protein SERN_1167 [Serinibacter arcticus]